MPESNPTSTEPAGTTVPRDVIGGVVLIVIAAIYRLGAGEGTLDWVFPITLAYSVGVLGLVLIVTGIVRKADRLSLVPSVFRGVGTDVAAFIGMTIAFVLAILPLGFWLAAGLTIFAASVYLAPDRSRRNVLMMAAAALGVTLVSYVTLEYVFYVPFPEAPWFPG